MGTLLRTLKTYAQYALSHTLNLNTKRRKRSLFAAAIVSLALVVTPLANALTTTEYPKVMASVGDSLSDRPIDAENWTTGTLPNVNSIHTRLEAASGTDVLTVKKARGGADSSALVSQMTAAVAANADLITVLMGGNDVCANRTSEMTPVATFQARYGEALKIANDAGSKVVAVSIPSLNELWAVGKESAGARLVWDTANICLTALDDPRSTDTDDVTRRALVKERNEAYNAAIAIECAKYTSCAYDNGAVYNTKLELSDLSGDYFHPNAKGQAKLAAAVWPTVERLYSGAPSTPTPTTPTTPEPTEPEPTTPTTPTPTTPAPTNPKPSTPETGNTTKTVRIVAPIRANIGVSKVEIVVGSKTYTGNVQYLGGGEYSVTVNTGSQSIPSGKFKVYVRAYNNDGTLLYKGTVSLRVKS